MKTFRLSPRIKTLISTAVGCFIYAAGIDGFLIPHNLLSGGVTGVAIMLFYIINIPPGTINLVLNFPVLFAAYRWLGRWAVAIAIFGTFCTSIFIDKLSFLSSMNLTHEPLIGSIVGGILCGVGSGIIYRGGGTSGGIDPIAQIVRKYWGLQMGSVILMINCVILLVASFMFGVDAAAITLVSIYIAAYLTNKVVIGWNQRKAAYIISYKSEEIAHLILRDLGRGATLLNGVGAYTKESKQVIFAVIGLTQIAKLKNVVQKVDPKAFLLITDASEVIGQGFTFTAPSAIFSALTSNPQEIKEKAILPGSEPYDLTMDDILDDDYANTVLETGDASGEDLCLPIANAKNSSPSNTSQDEVGGNAWSGAPRRGWGNHGNTEPHAPTSLGNSKLAERAKTRKKP